MQNMILMCALFRMAKFHRYSLKGGLEKHNFVSLCIIHYTKTDSVQLLLLISYGFCG